jgi:hypothetical protein
MSAAAAMSWPTVSPMASTVTSSAVQKPSNQSPPTRWLLCAGRWRPASCSPRGEGSCGSIARCSVSATLLRSSNSRWVRRHSRAATSAACAARAVMTRSCSSDEQAPARSVSTARSVSVHRRGWWSMAHSVPITRPSASVSGMPA